MAYALRFPEDVTSLIYSMRDFRWEMVRDGSKTPSARCFRVDELPADDEYDMVHIGPSTNWPEYYGSGGLLNIPNCEQHPDR